MKTKFFTPTTALLIAIAGTQLSACTLMNKKAQTAKSATATVTETSKGTIGIKNMNQLASSMSAVTGIAVNSNYSGANLQGGGISQNLAAQNKTILPWLSTDGNIETVNASMLLSITGLAGGFCKAFIAKEAALSASSRLAHAGVDFSKGAAGLTAAVQKDVFSNYSKLFLRRDASADEQSILSTATTEAISALGTGSDASTTAQNALLVPCTAVLASLDFIKI